MTTVRVFRSFARFVKSDDLVSLMLAATLLAPLSGRIAGLDLELPFGASAILLALLLAATVVLIHLSGVKHRSDLVLARFTWIAGLTLLLSIVFSALIGKRSDAFFTSEALYQISFVVLCGSIPAGLMETRSAKGTPSDVLATGTSDTAAICLVLFWILTGLGQQFAAAILMLLAAILVTLTLLLRMPGVIVPIYRSRRRFWRRRKEQKPRISA